MYYEIPYYLQDVHKSSLKLQIIVQTVPGAHPASYTMGIESFPGERQPGRVADHPPSSSAEVKERVARYIYSPSGPSWPILG
jgi:hypothetical protein